MTDSNNFRELDEEDLEAARYLASLHPPKGRYELLFGMVASAGIGVGFIALLAYMFSVFATEVAGPTNFDGYAAVSFSLGIGLWIGSVCGKLFRGCD